MWAFSRHQWYLTAEMLPVAILSSQLPFLAYTLLRVKPPSELQVPLSRYGSGWGKPHFSPAVTLSTQLCLVGADPWFTFYHLQITSSFLRLSVAEWQTSEAYLASAQNVTAVNVV